MQFPQNDPQHDLLLLSEKTKLTVSTGGQLTRREEEVLHWIALGKTNPEIATTLGISRRTVPKHVECILKTMNAENRGTAAADFVMGISSTDCARCCKTLNS